MRVSTSATTPASKAESHNAHLLDDPFAAALPGLFLGRGGSEGMSACSGLSDWMITERRVVGQWDDPQRDKRGRD